MYLGPPDFIATDAGKNFTRKEFSRDALSMDIIVTTVPVEAHWSIGTGNDTENKALPLGTSSSIGQSG